jgi:hypothetical protein
MQNSTSDPKADAEPRTLSQPPNLSESDFLAAQAAAARRKVADNLGRIGGDLKDCADVPAWARKYPWPTLGVAAGLGLLLGTAIFRRRPKDNTAELLAAALAARDAGATVPPKPSVFEGLVGELVRSLLGAVEGAIAGAFSSRMAASNPADSDGQPDTSETPAEHQDDDPA